MSRLQINFAPNSQARSPLRFGLGSALLVLVLSAAWLLSSETEAGFPVAQAALPGEEEIMAINMAATDLNFPWLNVLSIVENSTNNSLRLIQFDVDSRDGHLTLLGEARDRKAVLDLPGRLRADPAVTDARVLSQSPVGSSESSEITVFPIRFNLEVSFGE